MANDTLTNNILARYVKKNAFWAILSAVMGLWLLQIIFSYLGELKNLTESYTLTNALWYIFYKSPYFLEQFLPTGALLGAVVGLGLLANKSELIVMRASGVSIYRIVSWVLQPTLLFVLLALALNQFALPISNDLAEKISDGNVDRETEILSVKGYWTLQPSQATNGKDIVYIDYADVSGEIGIVKRWHLSESGNLQSASIADGGHYIGTMNTREKNTEDKDTGEKKIIETIETSDTNSTTDKKSVDFFSDNTLTHRWQLTNLRQLDIDDTSLDSQKQQQKQKTLGLPIAPDSVYFLTKEAEDLSLTQLYDHYRFMQSQGKRSLQHELAFWQKILQPLSIISLVIIACSFVFGSLRSHSLGLRIVVSLIFGLLFSYIQDLTGYVALASNWSPLLMVLLPTIASAVLGLWLLKRN